MIYIYIYILFDTHYRIIIINDVFKLILSTITTTTPHNTHAPIYTYTHFDYN